jgi:NADH:ubiquinone oxidoreductase subunit 5 (subunit L)/multisubunit Na+/H+ antiporter MnhA subunit
LLTPEAQFFVAVIGCITLTITALIAIVQTDIKKILAYSTLSQLGYMIFAMGIGAWIAALFHLMTHAFFKAMMFLGSGQVIEGTHHEQDIRKFGGLWRKMPWTAVTFFVGVLAIAGVGVPKTNLGIGGFFSKDEILAVAYHRAFHWGETKELEEAAAPGDNPFVLVDAQDQPETPHPALETGPKPRAERGHPAHGPFVSPKAAIIKQMPRLPQWMFWLPIIIAYVTPFYMMRCWYLTFWGKPRDQHVYDHAHESPLMYVPLVILMLGTFFCGWFLFRPLLAHAAEGATDAPAIVAIDGIAEEPAKAQGEWMNVHAAHGAITAWVGFSWVVGIALAILIYFRGLDWAARFVRWPVVRQVHSALVDKLYFDHVYGLVFVNGCIAVAYVSRWIDTYVIDLTYNLSAGFTERLAAFTGNVLDAHGVDGFVNGIADFSQNIASAVRRPQTGRIRNYVLFAAAGATIIVLFILYLTRPHEAVAFGQQLPALPTAR